MTGAGPDRCEHEFSSDTGSELSSVPVTCVCTVTPPRRITLGQMEKVPERDLLEGDFPAAQGNGDFHGNVREPWPQPSVPANLPGQQLGWPPKWVLTATGLCLNPMRFGVSSSPPKPTLSPRSQVSPVKGDVQNQESMEP